MSKAAVSAGLIDINFCQLGITRLLLKLTLLVVCGRRHGDRPPQCPRSAPRRGDVFEAPLNDILEAAGTREVTGAGTQSGEEGEIEFCDLEIRCPRRPIPRSVRSGLGAPKGSKLIWNDGENEVAFGTFEGLAVYLSGIDLPDEVYEQSDLDFVCDELGRLFGDPAVSSHHWLAQRRPSPSLRSHPTIRLG
jgi:hypothetical protein